MVLRRRNDRKKKLMHKLRHQRAQTAVTARTSPEKLANEAGSHKSLLRRLTARQRLSSCATHLKGVRLSIRAPQMLSRLIHCIRSGQRVTVRWLSKILIPPTQNAGEGGQHFGRVSSAASSISRLTWPTTKDHQSRCVKKSAALALLRARYSEIRQPKSALHIRVFELRMIDASKRVSCHGRPREIAKNSKEGIEMRGAKKLRLTSQSVASLSER